jgi:hypothetical protein
MKFKLCGIAMAVAFAFASAAQAQSTQTQAPKRDAADKPRTEQPARGKVTDRSAKEQEEERIEQQAKADKQKCQSLSGNAEDICEAEAKAKEKTARAQLDAKYDKSPRAQRKAAEVKAEGEYEVAKQKCGDQKGQQKDACMAQAKATHEKAKAQARTQFSEKTAERRDRPAATGGTAERRDSEKPKRSQ